MRTAALARPGEVTPVRPAARVLKAQRLRRLLARGLAVRVRVVGTALRPGVLPGDRVTLSRGTPAHGGLVAVSTPLGLELRRCLCSPANDVIVVSGLDGAEETLPEAALAAVVVRLERRGREVPAFAPGLFAAISRRWRAFAGRSSAGRVA